MNFKLWGLNILLAAAMTVFSLQAYKTWTAPQETIPVAEPETSAPKTPLPKLIDFNLPSESVFEDVVRKHLFSENRKEKAIQAPPAEEVEVEVKAATISGKKIILYGVIIMDDVKKAMIQNPTRKAGNPEYIWVQEGEKLHNLRIKTIQPDRILLTEKGKKFVVLLHDQTSSKKRAGGTSPRKKQKPPTKKTTQSNAKPQSKHIAASPAARPAKAEDSSAEYETIKTPFGTFQRKK